MTLIKRIWILRGELQQGIQEKSERIFAQILEILKCPGFEFEVMNSKMATHYLDILENDFEKILDRPTHITKIINNVKNLQDFRLGKRVASVNFGEEDCPMHTLWNARAKFEKLKYHCDKYKEDLQSNYELFYEINQTLKYLIDFGTKHLSDDETLMLMAIREYVVEFYDKYTAEWNKLYS